MGVGAARTERADAGDPAPGAAGPWGALGGDHDRHVVPGHVWVPVPQVQVRRDLPVAQDEDELDQAGDPRRRLEVADVGLDGSQSERAVCGTSLAQHLRQGPDLDGVAEGGAGAVGLDVAHLGRAHPAPRQRLADDRLLCQLVGNGEAARAAILVHRRAADEGKDRVPLRQSVGEPLEHHNPGAFPADEAIGPGIERLAAAIGGEHASLGRAHGHLGGEHGVDAPRQGLVALSGAEALAGQVHGDERGGASGVHG